MKVKLEIHPIGDTMWHVTPEELKQWRDKHGWGQQELAERLGVHLQTVSKWERDVQAIPPYLELALKTVERESGTAKYTPEIEQKIKANLKPRNP